MALKNDYADLLVLYTGVNGHESETKENGIDIYGSARSSADPVRAKSSNILVKSKLTPNENNNIIFTYEKFDVNNNIDERSWQLYGSNHRLIDSESDRNRFSLERENKSGSGRCFLVVSTAFCR